MPVLLFVVLLFFLAEQSLSLAYVIRANYDVCAKVTTSRNSIRVLVHAKSFLLQNDLHIRMHKTYKLQGD